MNAATVAGLLCACGDRISEDDPEVIPPREDGKRRGVCECFRRRGRQDHRQRA